MVWIIVAVIAFYFLTKSTPTQYQTGTVTGGGTSTPVPNKNMPAFYQQDNITPTTANNPRVVTSGTGDGIAGPTADAGNNTELSSVSADTGLGYANNGLKSVHNNIIVAGVYGATNDPFLGTPITKAPTYNSPISVPPSQTAMYGMDAASIAPLPPPQPKIETIVPAISSQLVTNSFVEEQTGMDRPLAFRSIA